jgi:uncharacterized protein (DUF427 family)
MTDITRDRVRVERSAKRVRGLFGGRIIVDTISPLLVWEVPYYPTYYLPLADVDADALVPTGDTKQTDNLGEAAVLTVRVGDKEAAGAALSYSDSPVPELKNTVKLDWAAMDSWFEEDEEVFFHVRSPYARIDILDSSRTVRIEVDGMVVAESTRPKLLFETGLPTRYYLPKTDVKQELLERSQTVSHCPYKGSAEYWSVRVGDTLHDDLVWSYRLPLPESEKVAGLMAFWDEKVSVYVDGVLQGQRS